MLKFSGDFEGLRALLEGAGYNSGTPEGRKIADAVIALSLTLDAVGLSKESEAVVMEIFTQRGLQELRSSAKTLTEGVWRDFDYGNVRIGDFVRVKKDAYEDNTGARHNGLVGILVDMRGGRCTVRYTGMATNNAMAHPMEKLESLKYRVE